MNYTRTLFNGIPNVLVTELGIPHTSTGRAYPLTGAITSPVRYSLFTEDKILFVNRALQCDAASIMPAFFLGEKYLHRCLRKPRIKFKPPIQEPRGIEGLFRIHPNKLRMIEYKISQWDIDLDTYFELAIDRAFKEMI